jgi:hypothetical protein
LSAKLGPRFDVRGSCSSTRPPCVESQSDQIRQLQPCSNTALPRERVEVTAVLASEGDSAWWQWVSGSTSLTRRAILFIPANPQTYAESNKRKEEPHSISNTTLWLPLTVLRDKRQPHKGPVEAGGRLRACWSEASWRVGMMRCTARPPWLEAGTQPPLVAAQGRQWCWLAESPVL